MVFAICGAAAKSTSWSMRTRRRPSFPWRLLQLSEHTKNTTNTTRREQIEYSRHLIGYLSMSVYVCIRLSLCVLHIKAANFAMMTVKTILQKSLIKREMIPILFRVYFLLNAISWRKFTQPLPNSECFSAIETSHYLQCQCNSLQKTASLLQCQ